ncbi:MAG: hypothetical protein OXT67_12935 [Zetaproteobacteria bacterium]|nr:hypothetical protein [Zetaproteobacteria bacterium]
MLKMPVSAYCRNLESAFDLNQPLTLSSILAPFKPLSLQAFVEEPSDWLELGCFLTQIRCDCHCQVLDPVVVLQIAYSLGYDPARDFQQRCFSTWMQQS